MDEKTLGTLVGLAILPMAWTLSLGEGFFLMSSLVLPSLPAAAAAYNMLIVPAGMLFMFAPLVWINSVVLLCLFGFFCIVAGCLQR